MNEEKEEKVTEGNEKKTEQKEKKKDLKKENTFLKEQIKKKENELSDYVDMLKHLQAEFENYKKRVVREQTNFLEFACKDIIIKILPVLDNLERSLSSARDAADFEVFKKGVEMVYSHLVDILKKEGLEAINPAGQCFNPQEHEALMQVESDEHEEGTVVEAMQKGYLLKGKVLRPAIVKVAKGRESKEKNNEQKEEEN